MLIPQRLLLPAAHGAPGLLVKLKKPAGALAAALLLAGCAQSPFNSSAQEQDYILSGDSAKPIQSDTLNGFLDQSPGNSAVTAAQSPWGRNAEVVAEARYFAASGRECRKLRIVTASQQTRRALVCRGDNSWVEQRLVTQTAGSAPR